MDRLQAFWRSIPNWFKAALAVVILFYAVRLAVIIALAVDCLFNPVCVFL